MERTVNKSIVIQLMLIVDLADSIYSANFQDC